MGAPASGATAAPSAEEPVQGREKPAASGAAAAPTADPEPAQGPGAKAPKTIGVIDQLVWCFIGY